MLKKYCSTHVRGMDASVSLLHLSIEVGMMSKFDNCCDA